MVKKNKKSNAVLSLWQRVLLDGRIYDLALEFRKKLGMPENGFWLSSDEFKTWHKKVIKDKKESGRIATTNNFIEESKKLIPYQGVMKEIHFRMMMLKFFYHNEVDDEDFNEWKDSGMDVSIIKDGKKFLSHSKEIIDGVYIKIKPFSTIDSILKYVESHKDLIRESLEFYVEHEKIVKPKKIKASSHFKRDKMIIDLNDYSKKEIEEYFGINKEKYKIYKHDEISLLMWKMGYKGVTGDIVKAIIQRRKIEK